MAKVESLGVHTPVALPYLIREGILPQAPKPDLYQWETSLYYDGQEDTEEEILATKTAVAWSQGRFLRHVYRFELEGEEVVQALLTNFPTANCSKSPEKPLSNNSGILNGRPRQAQKDATLEAQGKHDKRPQAPSPSPNKQSTSRALVVILKTKAHIYFLQGSSYIVDLPFEIERAFASPRGLVLEKKPPPPLPSPPTPQIPAAPPNSFFSSQLYPSQRSQPSFLESPSLARSFARTPAKRPNSSHSNSNGGLEALFQDLMRSSSRLEEEDTASIYSLTGPLSDFGVVSSSLQHQKPRLFGKGQSALNVEFEPLDRSEELVYISQRDELSLTPRHGHGELMLIVTANHDLRTLNIWHAWYIDEKSLASLLKQRAAQKAAKLRRRSSFLSTSMGTGATTPAVRPRDHKRESFAGAGSRLTVDANVVTTSRKPTRQEEEAAMASQMDPEYKPAPSQQPARESRRISSINADMRNSQNAGSQSYAGANRRNTSFGPNDRRSFGHRKSRGSTPGSMFSRSIGADDSSMDMDSTMGFDDEESIESVLRHIRATYESAGTENVFGGVEDGFRCEMVVRKLHSLPLPSNRSSSAHMRTALKTIRITTIRETALPTGEIEDEKLRLYIHSQHSQEVTGLKLTIKQRSLWPDLATQTKAAIPLVTDEFKMNKCSDIMKLRDGTTEAVLLVGRGVIFPTTHTESQELLPSQPTYRAHTPLSHELNDFSDKKPLRNRTIPGPEGLFTLAHPGARGAYDEKGTDAVYHRRWLQLRPVDRYVEEVLDVCRSVLPTRQAATVRTTWCRAHAWLVQHPSSVVNTASSFEWVALVATVFSSAISLLDTKARASLNLSHLGTAKHRLSRAYPKPALELDQGSQLRAKAAWAWVDNSLSPRVPSEPPTSPSKSSIDRSKDQLLIVAAALADEIGSSTRLDSVNSNDSLSVIRTAVKLMLGLHVFREEHKLNVLSSTRSHSADLTPVIAQLGNWLGLREWGQEPDSYYGREGASDERWAYLKNVPRNSPHIEVMPEPIGVFHWFERALEGKSVEPYLSLDSIGRLDLSFELPYSAGRAITAKLTPRTTSLSDVLVGTAGLTTPPVSTVEIMESHGIDAETLETLPEAIAGPFMEAVACCERQPPTTWSKELLRLVGREDLELESDDTSALTSRPQTAILALPRDIQTICLSAEQNTVVTRTREANRHAVSQLIFSEDRRLIQATSLMHFNGVQVAECPKQPDWTDAYHFEQQRRVMQWVTLRMIALPAGDGMIHFDSQVPLLTEKYHLSGFNSSCLMQPMGHTLTTDRSGLTEEKVNWAYFHAGVSAGLRISRHVKGIDTSWIAFNKPTDLTNRHAGLLFALGLNGHLRSLAKWLSFKYLTPKHNMTSVGLLLGLSVSYIGTMDSLITRMLSIHITRMLPAGAAELNVSPVTQTAGLMGIGMLYYNTQHRRMSEIMLSEIERLDIGDPDSGPDQLRDESYRLSAGFALGLINLAKGDGSRGLHGIRLPERLVAIAVGSRPVGAVHIFDRAPAGAIIALALIYMKSGDKAIARKVDIPDTETQFDHVRPDMLLLRAMAKHIILWSSMADIPSSKQGRASWIAKNLPACYTGKLDTILGSKGSYPARTSDIPFYNIATGLAWALSLRYAGSGKTNARDEILALLDCLQTVKGGDAFYYDAKLARATLRRCIDVLALAAATVMAGTGDLKTMRYLRRLHGRTDAETPYGSHLAAHLAFGALFLGGGTYTFGTSDLAIASLMCAFYPLFPVDVQDNRVHLQAFRHLWVLAAEARCLVVEDIDTCRPISMPIKLTFRNGSTTELKAPCLLPDLDSIASVQTADSNFWRVTLDFASNPLHLSTFRSNQRIFVRRCPASEAHTSPFAATLAALNETQSTAYAASRDQIWHAVFSLPAFRTLEKADIELVLPPSTDVLATASAQADERRTVVDDRLVFASGVCSTDRNALWNLRMLFAWAEKVRQAHGDATLRWIGNEIIAALEARVLSRAQPVDH